MRTLEVLHNSKIWFVLAICLQFASISYSQRPSKSQTIEYLNKKLAPSCVIAAKGGDIIATYTDESGVKIREDRVALGYLDTIVRYDAKEKILYINTIKGCDVCVTRKLIVQKVKRGYSRMSFVVDGSEKEVKGVRKALVHLIRIGSEFRYHDEIVFE